MFRPIKHALNYQDMFSSAGLLSDPMLTRSIAIILFLPSRCRVMKYSLVSCIRNLNVSYTCAGAVYREYEGYSGRNPKTGLVVVVKPKKSPFFKVGKELKERIQAGPQ